MKRTTIISTIAALLLAAFLILGCDGESSTPKPDLSDYCQQVPTPLTCK